MTRAVANHLGQRIAWWWLLWGMWVALPWTGTLEATPLWGLLLAIAPPWFWGGIIALLAVLKLVIIHKNRGYMVRAAVNFCFFVAWAFVFVSVALADLWSPQCINCFFFVLISWQLMNEALQNAEVERRRRCMLRGRREDNG